MQRGSTIAGCVRYGFVRARSFGIIALIALLVGLIAACASPLQSWQAPEVSLIGLQPKQLGLARQVFIATLAVRNPSDRTLPVKGLRYRLALEGQEVAEGSASLDRQIPAHGEAAVDVEVIGNLLTIAQRWPLLARKETPLEWTVVGTLSVAGALIDLPYRYSGTLDPHQIMAGSAR
ncbi:LEA type 2 family protein [Thiorhodococcus fuscus]|uniref:LEA type 2 family protein n=1 Tax=Thiorhodococcus fuscus TaxID=527200 RepID=A0ABW4Y3P9_9GAMM